MSMLVDTIASIRTFFEMGGPVLYAILLVTALMWMFILERLWYLLRVLPTAIHQSLAQWNAQDSTEVGDEKQKWQTANLRKALLSEVRQGAGRNLGMIESLMQVLPLLGLLGTVWGMVHVFDIMTVFGTGNARLMASGVSRATIPTMSGLVAALSALYLVYWLRQRAKGEVHRLEGMLKQDADSSASPGAPVSS